MDNVVKVNTQCRLCGDKKVLYLPKSGYEKYMEGMAIQDAMPDVDAADRELLISGVCHVCWDKIALEDDDEEDIRWLWMEDEDADPSVFEDESVELDEDFFEEDDDDEAIGRDEETPHGSHSRISDYC